MKTAEQIKMRASEIEQNWNLFTWERTGKPLSNDDTEQYDYVVMTEDTDGIIYEGVGVYSCGSLISVEDVEKKYEPKKTSGWHLYTANQLKEMGYYQNRH